MFVRVPSRLKVPRVRNAEHEQRIGLPQIAASVREVR
jgi:hypothetical protein